MQLSTWLGHVVKSGEVTFFSDNEEALQIKAKDNRIELNILSKEFLKDVVDSARGGASIRGKLAQLREIAEELRDEGLTVNLSYRGDVLMIMGSEARPKLSRLATRTYAVEIRNVRKLLELSI